nr:hypothetical protein [Algoriphagus locisalis]
MFIPILVCFSQASEYYSLYKGGDSIKKREVCLILDFSSVNITNDGQILIINYHNNTFRHNPSIHISKAIKNDFQEDGECVGISELYKIEGAELKRELDKVEMEKGFRPPPPIRHVVLNVIIILKFENENLLYEVEWI